jgi:cell division protein FtsW (lipid II flippase)
VAPSAGNCSRSPATLARARRGGRSKCRRSILRVYGWPLLFALPIAVMLVTSVILAHRGQRGENGQSFSRWSLLIASWTYFVLNFAFFRVPWPWAEPTTRTPSTIVFAACLLLLTLASLRPTGQPSR